MRLLVDIFPSAGVFALGVFGVLFACSSSDSGAGSSGGSSSGSSGDTDGGGSSGTASPPPPPTGGGCGGAPVSKTGVLGSQTIKVGTSTRTYELTLPASYDGDK